MKKKSNATIRKPVKAKRDIFKGPRIILKARRLAIKKYEMDNGFYGIYKDIYATMIEKQVK
jgi:hypothetical protein